MKRLLTVDETNTEIIKLMGATVSANKTLDGYFLNQPPSWKNHWPAWGTEYRSEASAFQYGAPNFFQNRDAAIELVRWINADRQDWAKAFNVAFETEALKSFEGYSWMAHCLTFAPGAITSAVCIALGLVPKPKA